MTDFNGEELIITLDPVVNGVLTVDVAVLYKEWKTWMLDGNMRFPEAFRTTGGDELTSIINAGAYFFVRNDLGWRIRPFENDGDYFFIGNAAAQDTSIRITTSTIGSFRTAILGLQPVTQGVTQSMAAQLEFNVFAGSVAVDVVNGVAGTGSSGLDPIGTRSAPSNNMADALSIAVSHGLHLFTLINDITITSGDFSAGFEFTADNINTLITAEAGANLSNCVFSNVTATGELDGVNRLNRAQVQAVTSMSGQLSLSDLFSTIDIIGTTHLLQCFSGAAALGYPSLQSVGSNEVIVRDFRGSLGIGGMTGGAHSIGVYGGRIVIEANCTGGTVYARGDPYEITDMSGGAVTIIDQTDSQKVREIHKVLGLDSASPMTVTPTSRVAGGISQVITGDGETTTTVTRQ
jgi:hypothetical protein